MGLRPKVPVRSRGAARTAGPAEEARPGCAGSRAAVGASGSRTEQAKASRVVDKGKAASDDEGGAEEEDDDDEEEPEEGPEEEKEPEEEEADEGPGGGAAEGQRVLARSVTRNLTTQRTDSGLLLKGTR